jgi:ankyrin
MMNDDESNEQELRNAIEEIDISSIRRLIKKNVVNVNCAPPSPLSLAAKDGHLQILSLLLDAGADIDAVDETMRTACHFAIGDNHFDALSLLLERGASVDTHWALLKAVAVARDANDRVRMALLLLDNNAPIDQVNVDDLMRLVSSSTDVDRSVALIGRLLARNVNVGALRDIDGRSVCHHVISNAARQLNVTELVRAMVDHCGIDVNDVDINGVSPLHCAAGMSNMSALRVLVELGADIDSQTRNGRTPLHWVGESYNPDEACARFLLARGADFQLIDNDGDSPLHWTARCDNTTVMRSLLALGGDLDKPNGDGDTARTLAFYCGCELPTDAEVDEERRHIARTRLDLVRHRAFQICVGMQALNLDALQMCEILMQSFGAVGSLIAFHQWWKIVTTVKHFHRT